ncbi:hypothetical protein AAL_07061 [Moelleriella libera RCEF 2490]|uniref:Uncharacterized protein n=1 Tax=Moelleriella libera RCEF 2490 TaxID=1081109 RepID=A0A167Y406_9HYPO|nr:hypothetical protein AAL_07061 [Moelleriella libera RCEF 2490]
MPSVTECQQNFDEISAIRQAAKSDYTVSNARKREIADEYRAAAEERRAASAAAMARGAAQKPPPSARAT